MGNFILGLFTEKKEFKCLMSKFWWTKYGTKYPGTSSRLKILLKCPKLDNNEIKIKRIYYCKLKFPKQASFLKFFKVELHRLHYPKAHFSPTFSKNRPSFLCFLAFSSSNDLLHHFEKRAFFLMLLPPSPKLPSASSP